MKKLFILFALLLIPAFAHGADVTGPFEYKLQCVSHVSSTVTGTTAETTLASCTIPGGAIGANGSLYVNTCLSWTNNGNNKTYRIKLGTTQIGGAVSTTSQYACSSSLVSNRNSQSAQIFSNPFAFSMFGVHTNAHYGTVDTSTNQTLIITCTLASASDSCAVESFDVFIMKP